MEISDLYRAQNNDHKDIHWDQSSNTWTKWEFWQRHRKYKKYQTNQIAEEYNNCTKISIDSSTAG